MFKDKTIINFTGKTCSGKSFLADNLNKDIFEVIKIDDIVREFNTINEIDTTLPIDKLIKISFLPIRHKLLQLIENSNKNTIIVDGIQGKKLIDECIDTYVKFETDDDKRVEYSKLKGWSIDKYNKINKIQEDM